MLHPPGAPDPDSATRQLSGKAQAFAPFAYLFGAPGAAPHPVCLTGLLHRENAHKVISVPAEERQLN